MSEYRYTEHEGRTGIWAQGEGVFFPDVPPHVGVHALYREGLRLAEIAVETGPGIDGLAARALRKEVIALRAERDRRAPATAELLAVVRAVAAWEEGTGRADLLEALEDYDRKLAGTGAGEGEEGA